jgi:hypothetical protein
VVGEFSYLKLRQVCLGVDNSKPANALCTDCLVVLKLRCGNEVLPQGGCVGNDLGLSVFLLQNLFNSMQKKVLWGRLLAHS